MSVEKDIVFHNKTANPSDGEIFKISKNSGIKELLICISGTSTSRTIQFEGATHGINDEQVFCPITGFKEGSADLDTDTQTTGTREQWRIDLTGQEAIRIPVVAVSGGYVTITGKATG